MQANKKGKLSKENVRYIQRLEFLGLPKSTMVSDVPIT